MRYYWYLYRPIYWGWGNLENPYGPTSFWGIPQLTCEVPCLPTDLMAAMVSMHATDAVPADPPDATHATEMAVEAEGNWVQWKKSSFNNDFHNKTSMYPGFLICWSVSPWQLCGRSRLGRYVGADGRRGWRDRKPEAYDKTCGRCCRSITEETVRVIQWQWTTVALAFTKTKRQVQKSIDDNIFSIYKYIYIYIYVCMYACMHAHTCRQAGQADRQAGRQAGR